MITAEFTAGRDTPKIFRSDNPQVTRFDKDMIECPVSIFVPFYLNANKIQVRIKKAISELVAELNEDFPTGDNA